MGRAPPVVSPSQARHQGRPIRPARIGAGDRDGNRHARGRPRPERPSATRTPDQKGKKHLRQEADPRLGAGEQTDGTGAWGADHRGRARAGFAPLRGPGARLHIRKKPPSVHATVDNPHRRCSALVRHRHRPKHSQSPFHVLLYLPHGQLDSHAEELSALISSNPPQTWQRIVVIFPSRWNSPKASSLAFIIKSRSASEIFCMW
jgi:hypothetical protein